MAVRSSLICTSIILVFSILGMVHSGEFLFREPSTFVDTGTTRASIIWRTMIDHDPILASEAIMYWRMAFARDSQAASEEALKARKIIATDPEKMLYKALTYSNRRSLSSQYDALAKEYWSKFAANDPEIAARAAMYWSRNSDADMYW